MLNNLDLSTPATATTHAPEVLAVALRSPDKKAREAARSLLMGSGPEPLTTFLTGQKSSHRANSAARLKKLLRTVSKSNTVDVTRFTSTMLALAHQQENLVLCSDILNAALSLKVPSAPLLKTFPPVRQLWLEGIKGAVPAGLGALTTLESLTLKGDGLTSADRK